MFNFFKKKPAPELVTEKVAEKVISSPAMTVAAVTAPAPIAAEPAPKRQAWLDKLKAGLRKTGSSIAAVFTGTQIDDALYEDLETALLMADTGTVRRSFCWTT